MAFGVVFSDSLVLEGPKVEKAFSIPLAKKRLLLIEENSVSILFWYNFHKTYWNNLKRN